MENRSSDVETTDIAEYFTPKLVMISPREYLERAKHLYKKFRSESNFWSSVSGDGDDCWIWTGSHTRAGYGQTSYMGEHMTCHRVAYALANDGELPPVVRHRCDTPLCVNPTHLIPGTQEDNMRDMNLRGRRNLGGRERKPIICRSVGL